MPAGLQHMTIHELGALLRKGTISALELARSVYERIDAMAEASSNLARYDGVAYGHRAAGCYALRDMYERTRSEAFGTEVKRRIMLATFALSAVYYEAFYKKASQVRRLIYQDFFQAFQQCDIIITPTALDAAGLIGGKSSDPLGMYCDDICTVAANLAGLPAMSVPCGFTAQGLPIGMQLIADSFKEDVLLGCAHLYEQLTQWHLHRPPLQ